MLTIDLICLIKQENKVWLLEIKPPRGRDKDKYESNIWEQALGQLLIYEELFKEDYPGYIIRKGVIFDNREAIPWHPCIQPVYEKYNVKIFKV